MLRNLLPLAALLCAAFYPEAHAAAVNVSVDTSSLLGQDGGIYFQFNPGLNADPASVSISDFNITPPGALNPASALNFSDGGVSGSLDNGNLTISNASALNDYGESLTFGSDITFQVDLNIPSQLTGDSGSELLVQVTGPDLLTPLLTADPQGNLITMSYDTTGALNVLSTNPTAASVSAVNTPEPGSVVMLGSALLILVLTVRSGLTARRFPSC